MVNFQTGAVYSMDNLDALRGMNTDSVDMVYLDPPFNTGKIQQMIGRDDREHKFNDIFRGEDRKEEWVADIRQHQPIVSTVLDAVRAVGGSSWWSYSVWMAARLLEIERVKKPEASVWIHCDDACGTYLRMVAEAVFKKKNFNTTVVWKRHSAHNDKVLGRVYDTIHHIGAPSSLSSEVRVPLNPEQVEKSYRYEDERGRYSASNLSAKGLSGGGYYYDFHGHRGPWKYPEHSMLELQQAGLIHLPKKHDGVPRKKIYLEDSKGQVVGNIWTDIKPVSSKSKERLPQPTQKPVGLLDRIVLLSSKPGDLVMDPFCGCGTTIVAAQRNGREWVGIDWEVEECLVRERMAELTDLFDTEGSDMQWLTEAPVRTDGGEFGSHRLPTSFTLETQDAELSGAEKERLRQAMYRACGGTCPGYVFASGDHVPCKHGAVGLSIRFFHMDHIVPIDAGGKDRLDNFQLICSACNSDKRARTGLD